MAYFGFAIRLGEPEKRAPWCGLYELAGFRTRTHRVLFHVEHVDPAWNAPDQRDQPALRQFDLFDLCGRRTPDRPRRRTRLGVAGLFASLQIGLFSTGA
jgi:hypothetical protein